MRGSFLQAADGLASRTDGEAGQGGGVVRGAIAAPDDVHVRAEHREVALVDVAGGVVGEVEDLQRGTGAVEDGFDGGGVGARG